jgi:hypothetical protein
MSIKLTLAIGNVKTEASLKDSAYGELMQLVFKHQDGVVGALVHDKAAEPAKSGLTSKEYDTDSAQKWISKRIASEVLNRIKWETNPEKILLLAAFHETNGGKEGWRSADINERFKQAKEPFPANFSRDIASAVSSGLVGAVTPRTYKVGRAGWNKIADAILKLPTE